jgi:hypothetical protein
VSGGVGGTCVYAAEGDFPGGRVFNVHSDQGGQGDTSINDPGHGGSLSPGGDGEVIITDL